MVDYDKREEIARDLLEESSDENMISHDEIMEAFEGRLSEQDFRDFLTSMTRERINILELKEFGDEEGEIYRVNEDNIEEIFD